MLTLVEINAAIVVDKLVRDLNHLGRLRDLERIRDICDSRHSGLEAIRDWVFSAIFVILLPFRERRGQVRNLTVWRIDDRALTRADSVGSGVRLDVAVD